jgi:transcriptional regulator with XRE-family HTH domain
MKSIGEQIKEARKERGITQKELSGMTGISQTFLSQIETKDRNASVATLMQLGRVLNRVVSFEVDKDARDRRIANEFIDKFEHDNNMIELVHIKEGAYVNLNTFAIDFLKYYNNKQ